MKQSIEKGIKDSGYNIKEKDIKINGLIVDVEWEEFYNTFGNDCNTTALTHSLRWKINPYTLEDRDAETISFTNFLLWKILKKLEERR